MAYIKILGSSSAGNGYVIITDNGVLLLECGFPLRPVLRAINYKSGDVSAVLYSHKHSDHYKYHLDYRKRWGVIYGTDNLKEKKWQHFDNFSVYPFPLSHSNNDGTSIPNYGYIIKHDEFGSIFFGTDTFRYSTIARGCDYYMVEANYSDALLERDTLLSSDRKQRIMLSHMSLQYTIEYLKRCEAQKSKGVILIHLSSGHSNADEFKTEVEKALGVPCYIADKNVKINLNNSL